MKKDCYFSTKLHSEVLLLLDSLHSDSSPKPLFVTYPPSDGFGGSSKDSQFRKPKSAHPWIEESWHCNIQLV